MAQWKIQSCIRFIFNDLKLFRNRRFVSPDFASAKSASFNRIATKPKGSGRESLKK